MGGEGRGPNAMCSVLCSTQSGRSAANQITATVPSLRHNVKTDEWRRWTGGLPLHSATVPRLYLATTSPAHSPAMPANRAHLFWNMSAWICTERPVFHFFPLCLVSRTLAGEVRQEEEPLQALWWQHLLWHHLQQLRPTGKRFTL